MTICITCKQRIRKGSTRSLPQNAYYWTILEIIGGELGYTKEELHEVFKAMFLADLSGKLPRILSTTELTTQEMNEYIEKIRQKAAELSIYIPNPGEPLVSQE